MGNTSPKDMDALLSLMNMVIYSIDKVKKLRLNREVSRILLSTCLFALLCASKQEFKVHPFLTFL